MTCRCLVCVPPFNRAAVDAWNTASRAAGWGLVDEPIPVGWTFEPGWGLTLVPGHGRDSLGAARPEGVG